jgi:hypothetical protein
MPLMSILLIVWGVLTAILVILIIYRSMLTMREDDQLFLDQSESHMEKEQQEIIARVQKVTLPVQILGGVSGLLILIIAGMWVYEGLTRVQ